MERGNRITEQFTRLQNQKKKALITYITAGDPNLQVTAALVPAMEQAGADLIELGVPYSDPLADGPVIQEASQRALKAGTTLERILELVAGLRRETQVPLVLMTYVNPILQYGVERFAVRAASAGVDGVIVPDLPLEEADLLQGSLERAGLLLIPLVAPTSTETRIARIGEEARGFVYCVSLTGVTGVRDQVGQNLRPFLERVRKYTDLPLAVGFGVSNPQQAAEIAKIADGVIIGSTLVKIIARHGDTPDTLREVAELVGQLKRALL